MPNVLPRGQHIAGRAIRGAVDVWRNGTGLPREQRATIANLLLLSVGLAALLLAEMRALPAHEVAAAARKGVAPTESLTS